MPTHIAFLRAVNISPRWVAVEGMESPITPEAGRYVTFMSGDLGVEGVQVLHDWDVVTEAARVVGNDVALFPVAGVQGAKLTNARIEKLTGAVGTTRNLTVVRSLVERWCSESTQARDRRTSSKHTTAAAAATLSDSTPAAMGIETQLSTRSETSGP